MISAVQGRFANLGMAKKLGVGFVLVLLLTALVAAIGVWSLQTISQRFDGLKQMSSPVSYTHLTLPTKRIV